MPDTSIRPMYRLQSYMGPSGKILQIRAESTENSKAAAAPQGSRLLYFVDMCLYVGVYICIYNHPEVVRGCVI